MRLHEKGGKQHVVPAHHRLEQFLDEYISAAGIAHDKDGPLFRTSRGRSGKLTTSAIYQQDAFRMIQRRARQAGLKTQVCNHTFRATGITAFLRNGGAIEIAQHIAAHESSRTTGLYDMRAEEITLDEVERILI